MTPERFLAAARVPHQVQPRAFFPWTIERRQRTPENAHRVDQADYTLLRRLTLATLHTEAGEVVMEDTRAELQKHLPIWLAARGRVLITGLGLGCVVRGLLIRPDVEQVDVIEVDPAIIEAIGPEFASDPRVVIHQADALAWPIPAGARWDCAWHDIWTEGDTHLQVLHAQLMARFVKHCRRQGAWAFPRYVARLTRTQILGLPRQPRRR